MDKGSQPEKGHQQSKSGDSTRLRLVDKAQQEKERQQRSLHPEDVREMLLTTGRHNFPKVTSGVDRTYRAIDRPKIPPKPRFYVEPETPKVIFQDVQPRFMTYLPWFAFRWRDNLAQSWRESMFLYRERYLLIRDALARFRKSFTEENRHY